MANTSTHEREIEPEDRPSSIVVGAVCAVTGKDPLDAPPLSDFIDPESLDDLFRGAGHPTVTFSYDGHQVVVEQDTVRVHVAENG